VRAHVVVRCYAELNDFLPARYRQQPFRVMCAPGTTAKDLLEGVGVPHTEIDLLLLNGVSVAFDARVSSGDRVTAYPVFEALDIESVTRVRPAPLRDTRFAADAHLGRLARLLRLAGFDTTYRNDWTDDELARSASDEHRVLLTRDQALLKRRIVSHGCVVRATDPEAQFVEVIRRLQLAAAARPFTRCLCCNGTLGLASTDEVARLVPPRSRAAFDRFLRCGGCGRVYWEGSHHARLRRVLERAGVGG
jgi:uncharacterized protein with PIN domain